MHFLDHRVWCSSAILWQTGTRGAEGTRDNYGFLFMRFWAGCRSHLDASGCLYSHHFTPGRRFTFWAQNQALPHAERMKVVQRRVQVPRLPHAQVHVGFCVDGAQFSHSVSAWGCTQRSVTGGVAVNEGRRRGLPQDPAWFMGRTLSAQVHGALDPFAAFAKQVLPAQDVHPRVQDWVEGRKPDGEKITAIVRLHTRSDVRRAVELIDKDTNLWRTHHMVKKKVMVIKEVTLETC